MGDEIFGSRRRNGRQYGVGQETAARIRRAAARLFAERGYYSTTTRELATAAGVVPSVVYHYVGTKDELLAEMMETGSVAMNEAARLALEGVERADEQLAALVAVHVLVQVLAQDVATVIDRDVGALPADARAEVIRLRDEYEAMWKAVIDRGVSDGTFEPADAHLARLALLEACNGVTQWYRPGGRMPLETIAERFARLALDTVRARAQRASAPITVTRIRQLRLDVERLLERHGVPPAEPRPERVHA